jgi:hypothetical protein
VVKEFHCSSPLIVRMGGLPCDVMRTFSTSLGSQLEAMSELQAALDAARAELVDRLYEGIHNAPPEQRHGLLAVKRDCFNGRTLSAHVNSPNWQFVEQIAATLAQRVLELERLAEESGKKFDSCYEQEKGSQYESLAALLPDPMLRCGLAVSSPLVAAESQRLQRKTVSEYGRRERRLAVTLLRYVSRAAFKLSPFSTFTPVGLASISDELDRTTLSGGEWARYSLVRLRRHILDRCVDLLAAYRPWRETLLVELNDSLLDLEDGRTLLRRPGRFYPDPETSRLEYQRESLVRARLSGPTVEFLKIALATKSVRYSVLVRDLCDLSPAIDPDQELDRLIDMGYLHLVLPWNDDDAHLEQTILSRLRSLPSDPSLLVFLNHLERLVDLEKGLLNSTAPAADYKEMERLIDQLLQDVARLIDLPQHMDVVARHSAHDIYQDVFCVPSADVARPVLCASKLPLERALASVEPLLQYGRLYDPKLNFLYSLGALLLSTGKHTGPAPLLQVFQASVQLWRDYVEFQSHSNHGRQESFNPYGLEILAELAETREAGRQVLNSAVHDRPDGRHISVEVLKQWLAQVPARFMEGWNEACVFLQPASADGRLWVQNGLIEGTGRMSSRYSALLPQPAREEYTARLARHAAFTSNGQSMQLLEVYCVQGDTLNVHTPQTEKVLAFPGTQLEISAERKLSLADLFVSLGDDGLPRIHDRAGTLYVPVHLGLAGQRYLPLLVKFLCAFGPTETLAIWPPVLRRPSGEVTVLERTLMGNVVLERKRWSVPVGLLRETLNRPTEPEIFKAFHNFRNTFGIPDKIFVLEQIQHPVRGSYRKPQFLDCTSPLFIQMLRAILASAGESVMMVEMLPTPDMFPKDDKGRSWALELLVDSMLLRDRASAPGDLHASEVFTPGVPMMEPELMEHIQV